MCCQLMEKAFSAAHLHLLSGDGRRKQRMTWVHESAASDASWSTACRLGWLGKVGLRTVWARQSTRWEFSVKRLLSYDWECSRLHCRLQVVLVHGASLVNKRVPREHSEECGEVS